MKQLLIPFLLCTFSFGAMSMTHQEAKLKKMIPNISSSVQSAGTIDYKTACSNCSQSGGDPKILTVLSKDNNQKVDLSVLSEDDLLDIFDELAAREDIPYEYIVDGCYSRAHKMAKIMAAKGITAGKVFLEGEIYADTKFGEVGWRYQVAPVVLLKKGKEIIPYVIDPTHFKTPVPQAEWKAKLLSKSKSKLAREYYTNRYAYTPDDRMVALNDYTEDSLDDMDISNKNFRRLLHQYHSKQ